MLAHGGIELTNYCNLKCKHCPTPTSSRPKGYATDETVELAIRYAPGDRWFSFHRQGEPLLHPNLLKYVRWVSLAGVGKPLISTNGLLLTIPILEKLLEAGLKNLQITLNSAESVKRFKEVSDYFIANKISEEQVYFCGNYLDLFNWSDLFTQLAMRAENIKYVRRVRSHLWAGYVGNKTYSPEIVARRKANCDFINQDVASICWDGTVLACCFDSEGVNILGNIKDYPNLEHTPSSYKLCDHCDPNCGNGWTE